MQVFERRNGAVARAEEPVPGLPELSLLHALERPRRLRARVRQGARGLGALALLAVGAIHLQQYLTLYSAIPTVGTLFVLNFAGATVIGLGLLVPLERVLGRRGSQALALLALAGAGLAGTAFAFLLVSERTPLFGFMEPGYDPPAIMAARAAELVAVALLGAVPVARLAGRLAHGSRRRRVVS